MPDVHDRIAAMSWQSRSTLSLAPKELATLPQAGENLEQLIKFAEAQVVTGPAQSQLKSPTLSLDWGEGFETVWANFERLSATLKTEDPSPHLKSRLDRITKPSSPPNLLYLNRAGGTAGPGTFVDAVFKSVGAENVVTTPGWQSLDTEMLLQLNPDIIVTSFMASNYAGVNDRAIRHSALARRLKAFPQIDIPGAFWPCAGPGLVDAAEKLSTELAKQ